jgi:hypothetical protein
MENLMLRNIGIVFIVILNVFYFYLPSILWKYCTKKIGKFGKDDIPFFVISLRWVTLLGGIFFFLLSFAVSDEKSGYILALISYGCYGFGISQMIYSFEIFKKEQKAKAMEKNKN